MNSYIAERKDILERVKSLLIEQLNLDLEKDEIDNDAPLFGMGLGLDSIDALDLIVGVEREFGVKVNEGDMHAFRSINSLVDYIMGVSFSLDGVIEEVDFLDKELMNVYTELRENGAVLFKEEGFFVLEMKIVEGVLEFLERIVAGRVYLLDNYKVMHSVILDEDGKILDIIYIMSFEDKMWFLVTEASRIFLLEQAKSFGIKDISEDYDVIGVEGVFSWKYVKEVVGVEILGLTYLRMYEWCSEGESIIVSRAGITGEYGYRFFVRKGKSQKLIERFLSLGIKEINEKVRMELFSVCLHEFRFPLVPISMRKGDSIVENELRWMIDWRRDGFIGKESIMREKKNFLEVVMCVVFRRIDSKFFELKERFLNEGRIYVGDKEVGSIMKTFFSPRAKTFFGYAKISKEWAYPGIKEMKVRFSEEEYEIMPVTTPLFLTKSSQVVME